MYPKVSYQTYLRLLKARHEAHRAHNAVMSRPRFRSNSTENDRLGEFVTQLRRVLSLYIADVTHEAHKEVLRMLERAYWMAPNIPVIPWTYGDGDATGDLPTLGGFEVLLTELQQINTQANTLLAEMNDLVTSLEE